jgi:pimeloyl-ACP methyl ester carboxylesterase
MTEAAGPGDAFAIGNDEQYRPVRTVGAQRVLVSGPEGTGLLACDASGPLGGPQRGPVVVVVHGALRDSDRYLASARHAARLAASDALIVAPQFLADVDRANVARADGALYWRVEEWKGGYPALGPAPLSSFGVLDSLLTGLALEPGPDPAVVVFGNSAGGQFVNRYAAVGRGPDVLAARGLRVRFVVANPSTYLYFSRERPVPVPDAARVNDWRYGFDRAPGYVDANPGRNLERYLGRDVTIVLGELDNDEASLLLEVSPAAMAQGANRLDRGLRYDQHVRGLARAAGLPFRHRLIRLAGVGHTAADVLAAERTREIVFAGSRSQPRA